MICVIPGCTFAAAFRSGRSGSPFGAGVGNDGASSDLYLTEDIRDSGGQNHRPTVFSSQVADIDASWLPPNVACVECIPLVMRNISAPERIHVLIDVTAP